MIRMYEVPTLDLVNIDKDLMYRLKSQDGSKTLIHAEIVENILKKSKARDLKEYPLYIGEEKVKELLNLWGY